MQIRKNKNGFNSSLKLRTFQKKKLTYFRLGIAAYVIFNSFDGIKKKKSLNCYFLALWESGIASEKQNSWIARELNYPNFLIFWILSVLIFFLAQIACQSFRPLRDKKKRERERERGRRRSEEAPFLIRKKLWDLVCNTESSM